MAKLMGVVLSIHGAKQSWWASMIANWSGMDAQRCQPVAGFANGRPTAGRGGRHGGYAVLQRALLTRP